MQYHSRVTRQVWKIPSGSEVVNFLRSLSPPVGLNVDTIGSAFAKLERVPPSTESVWSRAIAAENPVLLGENVMHDVHLEWPHVMNHSLVGPYFEGGRVLENKSNKNIRNSLFLCLVSLLSYTIVKGPIFQDRHINFLATSIIRDPSSQT